MIRNGPRGGMIQLAVASKSMVVIYDGVDMDERIDAQCSINKPLFRAPPTYINSHAILDQPSLPDNPSRDQLHTYHQRNNYMPHNPSFPSVPFSTLPPAVHGLLKTNNGPLPTPTRSTPVFLSPRSVRHARNSTICHRISANRRANRIFQKSVAESAANEAKRSYAMSLKIGFCTKRSIDLVPML